MYLPGPFCLTMQDNAGMVPGYGLEFVLVGMDSRIGDVLHDHRVRGVMSNLQAAEDK